MSKATNKKTDNANPIDVHVGQKLRARRILLGMSQDELAKNIGITFQQIQKYERGANRMGASRLYEIAKTLNSTVSYFFEGVEPTKRAPIGFSEKDQALFEADDVMTRRETLDLVRAYYKIQDPKLRHQIMEMAKAMAKSSVDKES